ncbi:MAG: DMT family transporter [Bacteroides sp.]|jgi:drug/metabolite transporter (DMT)-like permease|nr:DMT family transporter [Bacteroides sp.]
MEFRIGELAALFTAVCWTVTSLSFESAGRKVGSIAVNIIRLFMALALLSLFSYVRRGMFFPMDATAYNWFWLALSGIAGFVVGDLFLFKAFTVIGSRLSMLIMTLVPPITALIGWVLLGEVLSWLSILGMSLTMSGIALVIFNRRRKNTEQINRIPIKGLLYAIGGAFGQATGLVLSKFGMEDYDAFSATQIRVIAGIIGFSVIVTLFRRWTSVGYAVKHSKAMLLMLLGATFGPFLGVSSSLIAVQNTETGIASTIMSITPILIIPPTVVFFKQKVTWKELAGAVISVCGVALFFI